MDNCVKNDNILFYSQVLTESLVPGDCYFSFSCVYVCYRKNNNNNKNKIFTSSQSSFLPGGLCIAQLLSIIHEI